MNETIMAALIGGSAGILPVLVTRVFSRMENRSKLRQQVQALDFAKKRVEFVNSWINARRTCQPREALDGAVQEAALELDEIRASLKKVLERSVLEPMSHLQRPFVQRLLLAYKPKKLSGWWWRAGLYMWTGAIVASIIDGILRKDFFTGRDSQGEFSFAYLFGECIGAILILLPSVYFYKRAIRSDRADD